MRFHSLLPVLKCRDNPSCSSLILSPHQHVLHFHLSDGGQKEGYAYAEQSQLGWHRGPRGRLLFLTTEELQPTLELHSLGEKKNWLVWAMSNGLHLQCPLKCSFVLRLVTAGVTISKNALENHVRQNCLVHLRKKKDSIYIMSKNKNMSNISIYCVAEITTEVSMLALACHVLGYPSELSARTAS